MRQNLTRWMLSALALVTLALAVPAHAAWNYESVKWHFQGRQAIGLAGQPGFGGVGDTTWLSAAPSRSDTSGSWNMLDAEPSPTGTISIGGATADSTQVGAFIIAADSTVASTLAWLATTVQFQVNYGSNSTGWTNVGSTISPLGTTTQKALIFPMWQLPVTTAHLGSTAFNATYNIFAPNVRAIVAWPASAAVPMARCYVRKWIGTGVIQTPRAAQQVNP